MPKPSTVFLWLLLMAGLLSAVAIIVVGAILVWEIRSTG